MNIRRTTDNILKKKQPKTKKSVRNDITDSKYLFNYNYFLNNNIFERKNAGVIINNKNIYKSPKRIYNKTNALSKDKLIKSNINNIIKLVHNKSNSRNNKLLKTDSIFSKKNSKSKLVNASKKFKILENKSNNMLDLKSPKNTKKIYKTDDKLNFKFSINNINIKKKKLKKKKKQNISENDITKKKYNSINPDIIKKVESFKTILRNTLKSNSLLIKKLINNINN